MLINPTDILDVFKDRVKEERKKKGVTQEKLAEQIEVSVDTIKRVENGKGVKLDVAFNIAAALGVPFELLLPTQKYLSDDEVVGKIQTAKEIISFLENLYKK